MSDLDKITDDQAEFYSRSGDLWPTCSFTRVASGWVVGNSKCLATIYLAADLDAYKRAAEWFESENG